jgi:hypothetical protein
MNRPFVHLEVREALRLGKKVVLIHESDTRFHAVSTCACCCCFVKKYDIRVWLLETIASNWNHCLIAYHMLRRSISLLRERRRHQTCSRSSTATSRYPGADVRLSGMACSTSLCGALDLRTSPISFAGPRS